jgi:ComF family protein
LRDWLRSLVELLLPPCCADCGRDVAPSEALCARCDARLPRPRPGEPPLRVPALAACSPAVLYEGDVLAWIRRFKYPRRGWRGLDPAPLCVVRALALEAARAAPGPPPCCVVPIPLHRRRLRERGFNPAALLARAIARERGCRFDASLLRRVRDTPSQTGLDRRARRANVRGAFEACAPAPRVIWLVDDVVTTGSTLGEAARTLRRAGAREVTAICVAKTELR